MPFQALAGPSGLLGLAFDGVATADSARLDLYIDYPAEVFGPAHAELILRSGDSGTFKAAATAPLDSDPVTWKLTPREEPLQIRCFIIPVRPYRSIRCEVHRVGKEVVRVTMMPSGVGPVRVPDDPSDAPKPQR